MSISRDDTEYQFIRFKDGKEVFAMVREINDLIELHFPMNIQLAPASTGGILVHLGPYNPFTNDNFIVVDDEDILYRTSIQDQFIDLYDEACTAWLDIRDNEKIDIKSPRQVFKEQQEVIQDLVKQRFDRADFRDQLDEMIDDFEEEKYRLSIEDELPDPDDTIH